MRLVAQRVIAPGGLQGVNAFCFLHGGYVWLDQPPPEIAMAPGELVNSNVVVPPPGNRVRSYLDIVTPDQTSNQKILYDILNPIDLFANQPLPLNAHSGDTTFTFNIEQALAAAWHRELEVLVHHALAVRV
jgi:hypothetical protein